MKLLNTRKQRLFFLVAIPVVLYLIGLGVYYGGEAMSLWGELDKPNIYIIFVLGVSFLLILALSSLCLVLSVLPLVELYKWIMGESNEEVKDNEV